MTVSAVVSKNMSSNKIKSEGESWKCNLSNPRDKIINKVKLNFNLWIIIVVKLIAIRWAWELKGWRGACAVQANSGRYPSQIREREPPQ